MVCGGWPPRTGREGDAVDISVDGDFRAIKYAAVDFCPFSRSPQGFFARGCIFRIQSMLLRSFLKSDVRVGGFVRRLFCDVHCPFFYVDNSFVCQFYAT